MFLDKIKEEIKKVKKIKQKLIEFKNKKITWKNFLFSSIVFTSFFIVTLLLSIVITNSMQNISAIEKLAIHSGAGILAVILLDLFNDIIINFIYKKEVNNLNKHGVSIYHLHYCFQKQKITEIISDLDKLSIFSKKELFDNRRGRESLSDEESMSYNYFKEMEKPKDLLEFKKNIYLFKDLIPSEKFSTFTHILLNDYINNIKEEETLFNEKSKIVDLIKKEIHNISKKEKLAESIQLKIDFFNREKDLEKKFNTIKTSGKEISMNNKKTLIKTI
jgi:hypothetical protein